ncbi:MAG: hypothetical protein M5U26_20500 [Planctomycetota bacterium]|nr:hypothetical protein [Planctomycetota bacterium]
MVLLAAGSLLFALLAYEFTLAATAEVPWDYYLELFLEKSATPYSTFDNGRRTEIWTRAIQERFSILLIVSSLLVLSGIFALQRRFSLGLLFTTVMAVGAGAALPFLCDDSAAPKDKVQLVQGALRIGIPLSRAQVQTIQDQLQADVASNLFPIELSREIGLRLEEGVEDVAFTERLTGYGTQVMEFKMRLKPNLSRKQSDTIVAFYWWEVKKLAMEAAGATSLKPSWTYDNFLGAWDDRWAAECERIHSIK